MRVVFFGSPEFAVPSLRAIGRAGVEVALAVSQPARPAGRSGALADPAVARAAMDAGLPLFQPASLRTPEAAARLAGARADLFVVAAYGKILPQALLDLPPLGGVNVHGSLLPRWRGASPVQAALLAGDATTGVSIMKMDAGMDTGPVYATEETRIGEGETAESLGSRLATMGAALLVQALTFLESKREGAASQPGASTAPATSEPPGDSPSKKFFFPPVPQEHSLATYCPKISREDGLVDWSVPAAALVRRDRAFTPWPGLFTFRSKARLKLSGLSLVAPRGSGSPAGTVVSASPALVVACGEGAVAIRDVQAEGRRRLTAAEFVRGERVVAGEVWPS